MNLILLKPSELTEQHNQSGSSKIVTLKKNDERSIHILRHLRKKSGDHVSIGIIGECKYKALVQLNDDGSVTLLVQDDMLITQQQNEPEITVLLALPFPARLKALWPVLSSFCAVTRIIVVKGQLSNEEFCESSALQPRVYEPLLEKGMSQGVRTRPVQVDICVDDLVSKPLLLKLGLLNEESSQNDGIARLFLDCGDEMTIPPPIRDVVMKHCSQSCIPKAIIALGPERGWTESEAKLFTGHCGFESASLGSSILRVDTAAIAGVGVVSAALDECASHTGIHEISKKRKS